MGVLIVVPSWNSGRYVRAALLSVLDQSAEAEVELVVVDACSDDGTDEEIAAALARPHRARVTVVREPDEGQSDAVNKGIALGGGDIVGWLNADDLLLPGGLARVERFFAAAPPDVVAVYGDIHFVGDDGERLGTLRGLPFRHGDVLWGPGYIPQPATFVRRSAWERAGGLRTELHYAMDVDLWLRLSALGRVEHLPEVLACFRRHPLQKTSAAAAAARAEAVGVAREHARLSLGRTPSSLELRARKLGVRASRRLRRGRRVLSSWGAARTPSRTGVAVPWR